MTQLEDIVFGSTKCAKCDGTSFKLQQTELQGAAYKMMVAQCTSCSAPFGITDFYNVGQLLKNQEKAIGGLETKLNQIEHTLSQIVHVLNSRL